MSQTASWNKRIKRSWISISTALWHIIIRQDSWKFCVSGNLARAVTLMFVFVLSEVTVVYQNSLPVISVSLPSRRERCQFTLKPLSDSVGVFLQQLQAEDRGIDRVAIYSTGTASRPNRHHFTLESGPILDHVSWQFYSLKSSLGCI